MGKVVLIVVIVAGVIYVLAKGVWEWGGIYFGNTFSPASVLIAYNVPPYGSSGGTYKYRATLATPTFGGALNSTASIEKIVVSVSPMTSIGSPTTTNTTYTAAISSATTAAGAIKNANVSVTTPPSLNPVDLSFIAGSSDMAFTTGNMLIQIKYPYTFMYVFSLTANITYIEPVPVPYNPVTDTSVISELSYDYLLDHDFITEEFYEELTTPEDNDGE